MFGGRRRSTTETIAFPGGEVAENVTIPIGWGYSAKAELCSTTETGRRCASAVLEISPLGATRKDERLRRLSTLPGVMSDVGNLFSSAP